METGPGKQPGGLGSKSFSRGDWHAVLRSSSWARPRLGLGGVRAQGRRHDCGGEGRGSGTDSIWALSFPPAGVRLMPPVCLHREGTGSIGRVRRLVRAAGAPGARPRHGPGYKRELEN